MELDHLFLFLVEKRVLDILWGSPVPGITKREIFAAFSKKDENFIGDLSKGLKNTTDVVMMVRNPCLFKK